MVHVHNVHDTDTNFSIDPITRVIKNQSSKKTTLMQNDHNSERFTFELPRYIEGHDMSLCNEAEVHYLNISADKKKSHSGIYAMTDLRINPDDSEKMICSWLISKNATQLVGALTFRLRFECIEGKEIIYAWHTAIHTSISISDGINADESFAMEYVDIIEQWKKAIKAEITDDVNKNVTEWKELESGKVRGEMTSFSAAWNALLDVERKRIDAFVALPEGATTNDAELVDARIDMYGIVHSNVGEHLRNTIKKLIVELPLTSETIAGGYVNGDTGGIGSMDNFSYSDYISVYAYRGCDLLLYSCIVQKAGFAFYDENKKYISGINASTVGFAPSEDSPLQYVRTSIPSNAYYLRFSMEHSAASSVNDCHAHILYTSKVMDIVLEYVNKKTDFVLKDITPETLENGYGIHGENGNTGTHASLSTSGYIDVSNYRATDIFITCASNGWAGYAFYDSSKAYITGENANITGIDTGNQHTTYHSFVPTNACYLRYCAFVEKSTIPASVAVVDINHGHRAILEEVEALKESANNLNGAYRFAVEKILCIGDSLTAGAYYAGDFNGKAIKQNYPYYLSRICNCDVTNAGHNGYSASDWHKAFAGAYNFAEYDSIVIWLGTNYGCTAMPTDEEIDAFMPNGSIAASEANQALYLIKLINTIKSANPDCHIILCNVFASKSGVANNNIVVAEISEKYALQLVDMSDLAVENHPELHAGINNPHFGKAGNLFIANRIANAIHSYIAQNPERAEFGLKA